MDGEPQNENDLFFTCSLIEYISRKTKNKKSTIINNLGKKNIEKIYKLAEVYHSENIDKVADEFIESAEISVGEYDCESRCKYRIPTYWEIGRVYQRLILKVNNEQEKYIDTLIEVLSSWIIEKIDDYNSSMFYENPDYIYECYKSKEVL